MCTSQIRYCAKGLDIPNWSMASKKKYICTLEGEDSNGDTRSFRVYRKGLSWFADEFLLHPSVRSERGVIKELALRFGVKNARKVRE